MQISVTSQMSSLGKCCNKISADFHVKYRQFGRSFYALTCFRNDFALPEEFRLFSLEHSSRLHVHIKDSQRHVAFK